MLTSVLHYFASYPLIYDLIQRMVGIRIVEHHIQAQSTLVLHNQLILDVGGGTGSARKLWPADSAYVCLDLDPAKLSGLTRHAADAQGILADASKLPFSDASFDVATCIFVAHHIPDMAIAGVISEIMRVLKPEGALIFVDPVWDPRRPLGRLIWKYDRGSHPRLPTQLKSLLAAHGQILVWDEFAVYHHYALCLLKPFAKG